MQCATLSGMDLADMAMAGAFLLASPAILQIVLGILFV